MDYSVWYGESEALCLNVLIVEAKGGAKSKECTPSRTHRSCASGHSCVPGGCTLRYQLAFRKKVFPQLMGYMGMYLAICVTPFFGKLIGIEGCIHRGRKHTHVSHELGDWILGLRSALSLNDEDIEA
jgi:hypothetical protein